jgi:hypothetical protein
MAVRRVGKRSFPSTRLFLRELEFMGLGIAKSEESRVWAWLIRIARLQSLACFGGRGLSFPWLAG